MNSINTNMSALAAQQSMKAQNEALDQAMERLSSGLRINSAADDAAGSAIASKMEAQVRSLDVAIRNSYDAISMTQTAEGALGEMENILQRTRELAVQAGNSSLSTSDRNMIQKELDALVAELDSIATKTNFNGVKLLDGSNASIDFQIGINKGDALSVELEASGTKALGLEANRTTNEYTSGRVQRFNYNTANLAASDVQLNKQNALTANFTTDLSTANTATNGAKLIKDQINLNSSVHGVTATAFNQLTSGFKSEFKMSDSFSINGAAIDIATSASNLVDNINRQATGVTATLNNNGTITLENLTGEDIVILDAAGQGATDVGFNVAGGDGAITAGTVYSGFIKLENNDGSSVQIEANNKANGFSTDNGTINDVTRLGFNQVKNDKSIVSGSVSNSAILTSHDVKINDVAIGVSVGSSAASKAIAINAVSDKTLVTATASNEVTLAVDLDANPNTAASAKKVFDMGGYLNTTTFTDGTNTVSGTTLSALETNINALVNKNYTATVKDTTLDYAGSSTFAGGGSSLGTGAITTLNLADASSFRSTGGSFKIGNETFTYTGISTNQLTGVTRSGNTDHADGAAVTQILGSAETTIHVTDGSVFNASGGTLKVGTEFVTYTGVSSNSLTGVTRGVSVSGTASSAASHDDNAVIEENQITITAGPTGSTTSSFGSETFTLRKNNVAQTQAITFANASEGDTIYSKVVLSDGNTSVEHILEAADAAGSDNTDIIDALIAKIDSTGEPFANNITLSRDADGSDLTLTAANAGTAITGSFTAQIFEAAAASALRGGSHAITVTGSANAVNVMTLTIGSDADGSNNALSLTSGVVEIVATGAATSAGGGTSKIFAEFDTDLATTAANLVTKLNANSDLNFIADAGGNGDITLTAKNVGANVLTAGGTIQFNSYAHTARALNSAVAGTANTAGTQLYSTDTAAVTAGIVSVNGTTVDMSTADELSDVVTAINNASIGDLEASANSDGTLKITSVGGANIAIRDTSSGFVTSITDATSSSVDISTRASSIGDSDGVTAFGILNLKSSGDGIIKVSGDDESVLGLAAQAETQTLVSGGIKVNTLTDATQALVDIDKAIEKVSSFRSSFGAVENRIDASINNLTTLKVNTEAAKSRIEDADFASETSRLTKSQILAQAATSMLAQANASKQNLLALLQG